MKETKNDGMSPETLYETLRPLQEKQGYFFNKDRKMTMDILEQLAVNRQRYGYMPCPCRLANGNFNDDRDIVCPCSYRKEDVAQYGACFCGLYVSKEWNEGLIPDDTYVPDRRPRQNIKKL